MTDPNALDPRELIAEAYRIEGITEPDCRSIFFDWALGLPADTDLNASAKILLGHYTPTFPNHPMTKVLAEANRQAPTPVRRRRRQNPDTPR
jgi:hypothetical protein